MQTELNSITTVSAVATTLDDDHAQRLSPPPGSYAGFDETEPTSQQDGKAKVVGYLKNRFKYRYVTMIGDGVTDMEASPPAVSIAFLSHRSCHA